MLLNSRVLYVLAVVILGTGIISSVVQMFYRATLDPYIDEMAPHSTHYGPKRSSLVDAVKPVSEKDITVLIKTFTRPGCVKRLVQSIRREHTQVKILVADDSENPLDYLEGAEVIPLPSRTGCSYGKNELIRRTTTPYLIFVDDDMVVPKEFSLTRWVEKLEELDADLVAVTLNDNLQGMLGATVMIVDKQVMNVIHRNFTTSRPYKGCVQTNYILQAFAARTEVMRKVMWDPQLKTAEHEDFMLSLEKAGMRLFSCFDLVLLHGHYGPCTSSPEYQRLRYNVENYVKYTMEKWNLKSIFLLATHFDLVTNSTTGVQSVQVSYEEWIELKEPESERRWFAEKALALYNDQQQNWHKRALVSIGPVWRKKTDGLGGYCTVWVSTRWWRPQQYLDVDPGRLDLWIHMKYNNNSDALWFNFCFLYRVRQYAAEHTVYVVTAIKSVAQSFLLMQISRLTEPQEQLLAIARIDRNIEWIVVDFESADLDIETQLKKFPELPHRYIRLKGPFCRSLGLNTGINAIPASNPLVWVMDASMRFTHDLLDRARMLPERGMSVWAPVYYGEDISEWIHFGFGMVSFYREDFLRIGGYDHLRWGCRYGGEDLDLIERFQNAGYHIYRTWEPQLIHYAHPTHDPNYKLNRNTYDRPEPIVTSTPKRTLSTKSEIADVLRSKGVELPHDSSTFTIYEHPYRRVIEVFNSAKKGFVLNCPVADQLVDLKEAVPT